MSEVPKRRWFRPQYSLATLFVVVTVVGIWLGLQLKWIRDRGEFLSREPFAVYSLPGFNSDLEIIETPSPRLLGLLGEKGEHEIMVEIYGSNYEFVSEARRLFPESKISYVVKGDTAWELKTIPPNSPIPADTE